MNTSKSMAAKALIFIFALTFSGLEGSAEEGHAGKPLVFPIEHIEELYMKPIYLGGYDVFALLSDNGSALMAELTSNNIGKELYLGSEDISASTGVIMETIKGPRIRIASDMSEEKARGLILKLYKQKFQH